MNDDLLMSITQQTALAMNCLDIFNSKYTDDGYDEKDEDFDYGSSVWW